MNVVRLADVRPEPWRNGGGRTQALLAWPPGEDWQLRVSVAAIEQDGPFSAFPGIERWFTVLNGAGVTLSLPSGEHTLQPDSPPLCFDGAHAPGCRLLAGPTQDLNFMVRQATGRGEMRRATPGSQASAQADWRGLYAAQALTLELDGAQMTVTAGSLLWLAEPEAVGWQVHAVGHAESNMASPSPRAWWLSWSAR